MKTCCGSKRSSCSLANETVSSLLQPTCSAKSEVLPRSVRALGRVPEVFALQPWLLGDALTRWGSCRDCSACSGVLLCLKHKKACCALNGFFLKTGVGLRYENETSKINSDAKRLCHLPIAEGCDPRWGWARHNTHVRPWTRSFRCPWKKNMSNERLVAFSRLTGGV